MQILRILAFLFLLAGFSAQAQTRDEYGLQNGKNAMERYVSIFPNPAIEFVHVRFTQFPAAHVKVELFNIIGNEVQVEKETLNEYEVRLHVKDLAPGYYLIVFKDPQDKFQGTYKILKR
jgi:predicted 3-demethylubiquinone-9 3-methyltransferase (glyoxalase superfamily)